MAAPQKRKRRRDGRRPHPVAPGRSGQGPTAAPKSKDDIAREQLVPLREGERPLAVTIGSVLAALIAAANVIALLAAGAQAGGALPFAILMAVASVGMWRGRYWAVLGFQVILALTAISSLLFLIIQAKDPVDIAIAFVALAISGTLFWFLVRALARIQMPERRTG